MKICRGGLILIFLMTMPGLAMVGCGTAPPCETSLVTLDETRLDVETYEKEAAEKRAKAAEFEERLNKKNNDIEEIKDRPAELEERVSELKKGSGRE